MDRWALNSDTWKLELAASTHRIHSTQAILFYSRPLRSRAAINAITTNAVTSRATFPHLRNFGLYPNSGVNIAATTTHMVEMATADVQGVRDRQAITSQAEGQIHHTPARVGPDANDDSHGNLEAAQSQLPAETTAPSEPLYSVLTSRQKQVTVMIVSFVAMVSPLSGNIYYPAIPALAKQFHVSTTAIQLTITAYQVSPHHRRLYTCLCPGSPPYSNNSRCSDLSRYCSILHCKLFRQPRPETCIRYLPCHLPGRQHWIGSTIQLPGSSGAAVSTIDWILSHRRAGRRGGR